MYGKLVDYETWRDQIQICAKNIGPECSPQSDISDLFHKRVSIGVPVAVIVDDTVKLISDSRRLEPVAQGILLGSLMHVKPEYLPCGLAERAMKFQSGRTYDKAGIR